MKLTAIRVNSGAVGAYRVSHPFEALRRMGHEVSVITAKREGDRVSNLDLMGDVLVIQRQADPDVYRLVDSLPADKRPKVVYELDDNPWNLHSWDPTHQSLGASYGLKVQRMIAAADAVTCSTPTLAAVVRKHAPNVPVWVVPNAIDYGIRQWDGWLDRTDFGLNDKTVIGWSGSVHHGRDGQVMLPALNDVLKQNPHCVFAMQSDRKLALDWFRHLPKEQVRYIDPMQFDLHPLAFTLFDINLAPLEATEFNRCKSDLKLIEGGAQGVPYVASNIAPYAEFHRQSGAIGGYLAASEGGWREGLNLLLNGERLSRGASLKRYIKQVRDLSVVAGQWQTVYQAVVNQEGPSEPVTARVKPGPNDKCPCGAKERYKRCCAPAYG